MIGFVGYHRDPMVAPLSDEPRGRDPGDAVTDDQDVSLHGVW
jgi:hypothetical protein